MLSFGQKKHIEPPLLKISSKRANLLVKRVLDFMDSFILSTLKTSYVYKRTFVKNTEQFGHTKKYL